MYNSEGQTTRATSILGPKTASFYNSARLASVFWSSTQLGILDFSAGLRILGSEYSTFRPAFKYSARNTRLFGRPSNTRLGILDFLAELPSVDWPGPIAFSSDMKPGTREG